MTRDARLVIHQPNFLPRLKILQKLASADVWCVLDSVQYCSREWQNRARIVAAYGDCHASWLTVPVLRPQGLSTLIRDVLVVNPAHTARLIEKTLHHAFRRTLYWTAIDDFLSQAEAALASSNLGHLCVETTRALLQIAGRQPTLLFSSSLPVTGKATTLMAAICNHLQSSVYLADSGARNYLQPTPFKGIEVCWQNWQEPPEQWTGISSWRDLASVNYLARLGPEQFSRHLLSSEFKVDTRWSTEISGFVPDQGRFT